MTPKHTSVMAICERAAMLYGCSAEDLFGMGKSRTLSECRRVAMYAARHRLGWSYPELGRAFLRNHSSVLDAVENVVEQMPKSERMSNAVRVLLLPTELPG
jgi:chromosomal replication initiator protein